MASASSSVGASPTGSGVPETPLSVKSAGASPPQSSGKHLHINLGNQFRAGGSLPNVNNNVNCGNDAKEHSSPHPGAIHSIDLKVCTESSPERKHPIVVVAPGFVVSRTLVSLHPPSPPLWNAPSPIFPRRKILPSRVTSIHHGDYASGTLRAGLFERISMIGRANFWLMSDSATIWSKMSNRNANI